MLNDPQTPTKGNRNLMRKEMIKESDDNGPPQGRCRTASRMTIEVEPSLVGRGDVLVKPATRKVSLVDRHSVARKGSSLSFKTVEIVFRRDRSMLRRDCRLT
jgi:hypothetical protein